MKICTFKRKAWFEFHKLSSDRRRLRSLAKASLRRRGTKRYKIYVEHRGNLQKSWAEGNKPMPKIFCLSKNYEESALCIAELRRSLLKDALSSDKEGDEKRRGRIKHIKSYLDFSTIEEISPGAALVFAAEYDRAIAIRPWDIPIINRHKWRRHVHTLLSEIGFFGLLAIPVRDPRESGRPTLRIAKFETGEKVGNPKAAALMDVLAAMIYAADASAFDDPEKAIRRTRLYDALVEATENTRHHAYPDDGAFAYPHVSRWWITGAVDVDHKKITIVAYDQGITIPASLPRWEGHSYVLKGLRRLLGWEPAPDDTSYDGARIRLAVTKPRSSTGLDERGKGLPLLKRIIDECSRGSLRIVSRCGEFVYESGRKPRSRQLQTPMAGTLIEWELWL